MKSYLWMLFKYGPITTLRYERERRRRGAFDPVLHGEGILRAVGATEEQIAEARKRGLA